MTSIDELYDILHLKQVEDLKFEGISKTVGSPNVFGGQVLAQALNAAYRSINNGRILHSMHSYFLEAGDLSLPIIYDVGIMRDGGSFSVRRVTASQNGKLIFILSASFHKKETGYEHQLEMKTNIKQPEDLLSWDDLLERFGDSLPPKTKTFLEIPRPVSFKPVQILNSIEKRDSPPYMDVWFKVKGDASGYDLGTKQQILTYISDYNILAVALHRHGSKAHWANTQTASLDHSMWYYRDFNFDDWLLFTMDTPSASNARGFARGNIYTRDGVLVASVAQEGLMRPMK